MNGRWPSAHLTAKCPRCEVFWADPDVPEATVRTQAFGLAEMRPGETGFGLAPAVRDMSEIRTDAAPPTVPT